MKAKEMLPETVFEPPPRNERHHGRNETGLAARWEAHINRKYASRDHGVDTAKAFARMDINKDARLDREEILTSLMQNKIDASPAEIEELLKAADYDGDGHVCSSRSIAPSTRS